MSTEVIMSFRLKRVLSIGSAAVVVAGSLVVHASDPIGVYARIDKVVMEPDRGAPQRIQVWGVFSIADARSRSAYLPVHSGYLYFSMPSNTQALREWADLERVAGTQQIVGFGSRWGSPLRVRESGEAPGAPDSYVINIGVVKINSQTNYAPVRALITFKP
jgi:hypothetical protein